ncbi:MAG: HEAT repeat domain-containing protein [Gemmataceae bacterium]
MFCLLFFGLSGFVYANEPFVSSVTANDGEHTRAVEEKDQAQLIKTLQSGESPDLRMRAALDLERTSSEPQVIRALLNAMEGDHDEDVRSCAAFLLRVLKIHSEEVAAAFKRALKDAHSVRIQAAFGLVKIEDPKVTTSLLLNAMRRTDQHTIYGISHAIADENEVDVEAISKAFTDKDKYVRAGAAMTLRLCCREKNKALVPQEELLKALPLLEDRESIVRSEGAKTLAFVTGSRKRCVPSLIKALHDEDTYVRGSAASSLGHFGAESVEAVDRLIELTSDKEAHVRESSCEALGRIKAESNRVMPVLINGLKDDHPFVKFRCAIAIDEMGFEAGEFFPSLLNAWKASKNTEQSILARVLYKIDPDLAGKSGVPKAKN